MEGFICYMHWLTQKTSCQTTASSTMLQCFLVRLCPRDRRSDINARVPCAHKRATAVRKHSASLCKVRRSSHVKIPKRIKQTIKYNMSVYKKKKHNTTQQNKNNLSASRLIDIQLGLHGKAYFFFYILLRTLVQYENVNIQQFQV